MNNRIIRNLIVASALCVSFSVNATGGGHKGDPNQQLTQPTWYELVLSWLNTEPKEP